MDKDRIIYGENPDLSIEDNDEKELVKETKRNLKPKFNLPT